MRRIVLALALGLQIAMVSPVPAAPATGEVRVSFKPVEELSDVGRGADRERNVRAIAAEFEALAARLPGGEVLEVEALDVDMAGELRLMHSGQELRVMRGGADWPRIELRWTLRRDGRTLASGHDRLADMNYLDTPLRPGQTGTAAYEGRMIERWFDERVAGSAAR